MVAQWLVCREQRTVGMKRFGFGKYSSVLAVPSAAVNTARSSSVIRSHLYFVSYHFSVLPRGGPGD